MNNKLFLRAILITLSYIPIASIATVAQAKESEIAGELQGLKILETLSTARSRILPKLQIFTTFEDARKRYSEMLRIQLGREITPEELEFGLINDIEILKQSGIITTDEKIILASSPSEHIGK